MSTWTPQPAGLNEVLQVLRESTGSESPAVQKANTMVRATLRVSGVD